MKVTDVVIVGAGIAGVSCAFALANLGIKVTLIERRHPAAGPTGVSSAICHTAYLMPELSRLAARGTEILRNLPALTGGPSCFTQVGMFWVLGARAAPAWRAAVARMQREGIEIETLAPDEVRRRAPEFNCDDIALGVWEPGGGYADPFGATNALAAGARVRGAEIVLNTTVTSIAARGGRVFGVDTADGRRFAADVVVLATGVWTRPLLVKLGIDLPIHVERHAMAVLDAPSQARGILPFAWCDDILCHYARPEGESTILAGTWSGGGTGLRNHSLERSSGIVDPESYDTTVDLEESAGILSRITPRIPALGALGIRQGYAGLYDMSPDDYPIVGSVADLRGGFVICGSSGHGFKLGPAIGEETARLITGKRSQLLAPFGPERFA